MNRNFPYAEQTDETLVSLTLVRDESAFEELVKRHRRAALLIAQNVTRNTYTAEDAVQDAFLAAWQRLDTLKDGSKFGQWVCRIAKYRAINLAKRYRDYIPFDEVENYINDVSEDIAGYYDDRMETELLRACVEKLSEKIGTVIKLHYFEGLSVSEIAHITRLKEGTVKSRLSAGREQIRKELGYMDKNNPNETLVEAVMRRVEEFKRWRLRNSKKGFEEDYRDVLAQVESLPDSEEKFYAMADVMKLGYWYLSDGKSDEMKQKLREAAVKGNNKDVLALIIGMDDEKYTGNERVEYIYNTVIPELLKYGIEKEVAYHHYWLGIQYMDQKDYENARKEFSLALETGAENPLYTALAKSTLTVLDVMETAEKDGAAYSVHSTAEELIREGDRLIFSQEPGFGRGDLDIPRYAQYSYAPLAFAGGADHVILDETMQAGDTIADSEGKVILTCVSKEAEIVTPCGTFQNCVEMTTSGHSKYRPSPISVVWYKRNIGVVAFGWKKPDGEVFGVSRLKSFHIEGGLGYIPMAVGNTWQYETEGVEYRQHNTVKVTAVEGDRAYLSVVAYFVGKPFDEHSWKDNMLYACNYYIEYPNGGDAGRVVDVSAYYDRAAKAAKTPWEKKMTEVSRTVMDRIYAGEPDVNPATTQKGVWNFFEAFRAEEVNGKITLDDSRGLSFEAKDAGDPAAWKALHNDIYGILSDNLGYIWNPAWLEYADRDEDFEFRSEGYGHNGEELVTKATVKTVKTGEVVETAAGKFENCLNIRVQPTYEHGGWAYRTHTKDYWFAPGVGIVRVIIYGGGDPVYDLVAYEGMGEGYMPIREGLTRRYEYVGDEPRIHAGVTYHCLRDDNGDLRVLADRTGMMDI